MAAAVQRLNADAKLALLCPRYPIRRLPVCLHAGKILSLFFMAILAKDCDMPRVSVAVPING